MSKYANGIVLEMLERERDSMLLLDMLEVHGVTFMFVPGTSAFADTDLEVK